MAEAKKTQESAPVESQPTAQPQQSAPSGGNKNLGVIAGVVLVVVALVAGYGYWNGSQIKGYAEKAQGYMNSATAWDDHVGDVALVKADVARINSELNSKKAPSKASKLESYLKEYFSLANEMADLYEVQAAYTEVGEALTDAGSAAYDYSSPDSMVDSLKAIQEELDKQIEALEKLEVPEALKEYNDDMVSALKEMSSAFGSFVDAVEAGDETAMIEASNDLTEVMTLFGEIEDPEETIAEEYDTSKLDDLEKNIETEISNLKNLSFVLL